MGHGAKVDAENSCCLSLAVPRGASYALDFLHPYQDTISITNSPVFCQDVAPTQ